MKSITVNIGTTNMPNTYELRPTTRKGFYNLSAASFSSVVSKNTIKITSIRNGEDFATIQERVKAIKAKWFKP